MQTSYAQITFINIYYIYFDNEFLFYRFVNDPPLAHAVKIYIRFVIPMLLSIIPWCTVIFCQK